MTRLTYDDQSQSWIRKHVRVVCTLEAEGSSPRSGTHFSIPCKSVSGGWRACDGTLKNLCQRAEESMLESWRVPGGSWTVCIRSQEMTSKLKAKTGAPPKNQQPVLLHLPSILCRLSTWGCPLHPHYLCALFLHRLRPFTKQGSWAPCWIT